MANFPGKERRDVVLSVQTEDPEVKTPRGPESERKSVLQYKGRSP